MANEIDPSSVDLGKNLPLVYTANYLPKAATTIECASYALPPALELKLTTSALLQLDQTCLITFPDVLPLPPTYNPPNVKFLACETFSASASLHTNKATSKSTLTLQTLGPKAATAGGPAECGFTLDGNFVVEACETFDASVNVAFGKQLKKKNSKLELSLKEFPNCGFDLHGNIDIEACEKFTGTQNISFLKAARGSLLSLKSKSAPECGFDLTGAIVVDACETFTPKVDIQLTGPAVRNTKLLVAKADTPDCGFDLTYNADIEACTSLTVENKVSFSGLASGNIQLSSLSADAVTGSCGLALVGNINVDVGNIAELNFCKGITMDVVTKRVGNVPINLPPIGDPLLLNSNLELLLSARWLSGEDACSKILELTLESQGGLSFNYAELKKSLADYTCESLNIDGTENPKSFMSLNWMQINRIQAPGWPCSDSTYGTFVNFSESIALIQTIGTERVESAQSCPCSGALALCDDPNLYLSCQGLTLSASSETLQLYSTDSGANASMTARAFTVNDQDATGAATTIRYDGIAIIGRDAKQSSLGPEALYMSDDVDPSSYTNIKNGSVKIANSALGTAEITGNLIRVDSSALDASVTIDPELIYLRSSEGGTVSISPSSLLGLDAYFVPITVCVDGKDKTMFVLGTYPV